MDFLENVNQPDTNLENGFLAKAFNTFKVFVEVFTKLIHNIKGHWFDVTLVHCVKLFACLEALDLFLWILSVKDK